MTSLEIPTCPTCAGEISSLGGRHGSARRAGPIPDGTTGYCMACHIGLTKTLGVWGRTGVPHPA